MAFDSRGVILYDQFGGVMAVYNAGAITFAQPGMLVAGSDGAAARFMYADAEGAQRVRPRSKLSTLNTTVAALGIGGVFTGTFEEVWDYAEVSVGVFSDQASAVGGFVVQWSANGVTIHDNDTFSAPASNGQQVSFGPKFQYARIVYTNGAVAQGSFSLQTILHAVRVRPSTHRLADSLNDEQDAELSKSVIAGPSTAGGTSYVNVKVNPSGALSVTTELSTLGTLANGVQTAVSSVAVQILAANANRKKLLIQNVGVSNMRVGIVGVTATTGLRLRPGGEFVDEMPHVTQQAIFAIREVAVDTTALAMEWT